MFSLQTIIFSIAAFLIGIAVGYFILSLKKLDEKKEKMKADRVLKEAEEKRKKIISESQSRAESLRSFIKNEKIQIEAQRQRLDAILKTKEQLLAKKIQRNTTLEHTLDGENNLIKDLKEKETQIKQQIEKQIIAKAAFDIVKAKEILFSRHEQTWRLESEKRLNNLAGFLEENKIKEAKNLLAEIIYRFAKESSVDTRTGEILVPDNFKGKIVGQGGRNIIFFEQFFDVGVVFNDAPDTITLSSFNLLNRETAKFALNRLMHEREINEEKIKQTKVLAEKDIDYVLKKDGMGIAKMLELKNAPLDLVQLIGRLNYRTSYGQNVLKHSLEVAYISQMLACELNANPRIALIAGLFHDIGKAVDKELNQSHDQLTKEILEKYKFPQEIVHAAWTHHDTVPIETIEAMIVKTADAVSASRPGARSLSLEQYLAKIKELEEIGASFKEVKKSFTISAGRELRAFVDSEKVNDAESKELAEKIADKIEEKGNYPGKIKVTTIRITKATEYAKRSK